MTKTVYFHMGTVKTGSTFLQKFCHENPDFLTANDLAYPHVTPPELHLPRYANASFLWQEETYNTARAIFDELPQSRFLISEEGLMGFPSKIHLPLFRGFKKKAIVYIRPPADLVAAWAAERCKPYHAQSNLLRDKTGLQSFERGILLSLQEYGQCMNRLAQELFDTARSDIVIRPYERSQFRGGTLISDFLKTFDMEPPAFGVQTVNASPTRKYCDISHMAWVISQQLGVSYLYNHLLVDEIYAACKSGDGRPIIDTLTDGIIERISAVLNPVEDLFSQNFYGGRPLFQKRHPAIYGKARQGYIPLDQGEVDFLTREALNKRLF